MTAAVDILSGLLKAIVPVLAGAALLCAAPASAACAVTATPIAFGLYNTVTKTEVQTIATVTMQCTDLIAAVNYTVSLSPGQSGTATGRYLSNGTDRLNYQVFADATRTQILGDGSLGTVSAAGIVLFVIGIGIGTSTTQLYPVIRAGQSPSPGAYADTLTVLVSY